MINCTDDPGVKDALGFLMTREIAHQQSFEKALYSIQPNFPTGKLQGKPEFANVYIGTIVFVRQAPACHWTMRRDSSQIDWAWQLPFSWAAHSPADDSFTQLGVLMSNPQPAPGKHTPRRAEPLQPDSPGRGDETGSAQDVNIDNSAKAIPDNDKDAGGSDTDPASQSKNALKNVSEGYK